jgi:hypothetical protein
MIQLKTIFIYLFISNQLLQLFSSNMLYLSEALTTTTAAAMHSLL